MKYQFDIIPYPAEFKKPAKTSRNTFGHRDIHFIRLWEYGKNNLVGWGESAPLELLSKDDVPEYPATLERILSQFAIEGRLDDSEAFKHPSIVFGIETAFNDLQNGSRQVIFHPSLENFPIPINGLVWMDEIDEMINQALSLVDKGFDCIKFKVGALDFDAECRMLESFRKRHDSGNIIIRLDANGAFHPMEAREQLKTLRKFGIHSIEQPIHPGLWEDMAKLVAEKIIPIALDEELIHVNSAADMTYLMKNIRPDYIVLKPSLHGGYSNCLRWMKEAENLQAGFWITSALETNIGLNGIAQFTAAHVNSGFQGLGTGSLYKNNISGPLHIQHGFLHHDANTPWDFSPLLNPKPIT